MPIGEKHDSWVKPFLGSYFVLVIWMIHLWYHATSVKLFILAYFHEEDLRLRTNCLCVDTHNNNWMTTVEFVETTIWGTSPLPIWPSFFACLSCDLDTYHFLNHLENGCSSISFHKLDQNPVFWIKIVSMHQDSTHNITCTGSLSDLKPCILRFQSKKNFD